MRRTHMRREFLLPASGWLLLCLPAAVGAETESARFVIDSARSEVRFHIQATKHTVVGRSRSLEGSVSIAGKSLSSARNGEAQVTVSSLDTGKGRLNRNMHKSLEADWHPEIRFQAESFEMDGQAIAADNSWRGVMEGILTVRGEMRPVTFQVTGGWEGEELHAQGSTEFKMTYFGIDPPRFLRIFKVKDHVRVEFDVVAVSGSGSP